MQLDPAATEAHAVVLKGEPVSPKGAQPTMAVHEGSVPEACKLVSMLSAAHTKEVLVPTYPVPQPTTQLPAGATPHVKHDAGQKSLTETPADNSWPQPYSVITSAQESAIVAR